MYVSSPVLASLEQDDHYMHRVDAKAGDKLTSVASAHFCYFPRNNFEKVFTHIFLSEHLKLFIIN